MKNKPSRIFANTFILCLTVLSLTGQKTIDVTLEKLNKGTVPYTAVSEVATLDGPILLDTRAKEEYEVSHLQDALWVGYEQFDPRYIQGQLPDKDTPIVVYCSIGVRSEDIGEKLLALGYTNVTNLYGGIFQWKNQGQTVYDLDGKPTHKVHAFDKEWGKLLKKGKKVYAPN